MTHRKLSENLSTSTSSLSSSSSKHSGSVLSSNEIRAKFRRLFHRHHPQGDVPLAEVVVCQRMAKVPKLFRARRRQSGTTTIEHNDDLYTDDNTDLMTLSSAGMLSFEQEANTFDEYTRNLEEALILLRDMKREEYEGDTARKILHFLENLIHQPKEYISGAKLKLSEMKFPEMAMTLMNSYKEKGYLVRHTVFIRSILLYNSMSNFTDHEFDKDGLIRKQSADAGFIEFACDILNDLSYRESLRKCYVIQSPEETMQSDDFSNYRKILHICDSALTILYNLANLPELKIHFRECNAMKIVAEYTQLPSNTIKIRFPETNDNDVYIANIKQLREVASAVRMTSYLLLPLIMNEDEDNLLAANTSEVFALLSGMIQSYDRHNQRFYGFSFIELVDGLSKLMVRGRTHTLIDEKLIKRLLNILERSMQDNSLLECVSSAILNAAFDEKVQTFLRSDDAIHIIRSTQNNSRSQLVQKNCEAILWTLNRIPHKSSSTLSNSCQLQGHIMISYNRSVTNMCLKMRDRLKVNRPLSRYVWLDVDNINGGVLESMAQAVENSSIVLICMNEQYKQSYYCRLEAEYATELRKPCIPCLMQPRFRPYGWLGIIKGAKIHVDFATLPFEEAFSLLIREIETIRGDIMAKNTIPSAPYNTPLYHQPSIGFTSTDSSATNAVMAIKPSNELQSSTLESPVMEWDLAVVKQWLARSELSHLESVFTNVNGKSLCGLYQMKQSCASSYYTFLDKHFDRRHTAQLSDILKFDDELQCLFQ